MTIPGLLSTSYRCLNCGIGLKKSQKDNHLEEFPFHEIYKTQHEESWEESTSSQDLIEENKILRKQIQDELIRLKKLQITIQTLKDLMR